MTIRWRAAAGSHVGRVRQGNEDCYREDVGRGVFLVADGMGGHAAGEVASAIAADTIVELFAEDGAGERDRVRQVLENAFPDIQQRLIGCCARDPEKRGMGTTLTALHLCSAGVWRVGHIGDSRAYRLRDSALEQLTTDHTWVQREVENGRLRASAASGHHLSHILTRVLTDEGDASPDLLEGAALPGDRFLLVSDGLYGMLDDLAIRDVLLQEATLAEQVERLIFAANANGGVDNITAILVEISSEPPTAAVRAPQLAGSP